MKYLAILALLTLSASCVPPTSPSTQDKRTIKIEVSCPMPGEKGPSHLEGELK